MRGVSDVVISLRATALESRALTGDGERDGVVATFSSTIVFHSPQAGHLPIQRGDDAPQDVHTHIDLYLVLAIFGIYLVNNRARTWDRTMAVAVATFSDSEVGRSGGHDGMSSRRDTHCSTSGEIPDPSFPITTTASVGSSAV